MTPRQCRTEVARLVSLLLEEGVAIDGNMPLEIKRGDRIAIEPPVSRPRPDQPWMPEFGCIDEYLGFLRTHNYACVLFDGALLQLSFRFRRQVLDRHRFCFYPCPVVLEEDLVAGDLPLDEVVEMHLEGEARDRFRLRSPLRFDYDPQAARPGHAASHLHLCHQECRWPVEGPVSLGHFVRLVIRHFYPQVWESRESLRSWAVRRGPRTLVAEERRELYIACGA